VLVRTVDGEAIVLDLGTGARNLGVHVCAVHEAGGPPVKASVLLTHLHFDHILGLPFFEPLLHQDSLIDIYGPRQADGSLAVMLSAIMRPPYFPVQLENLQAQVRFHELVNDDFALNNAKVRARQVSHPGTTLGYRIEVDGTVLTYLPDHQQPLEDGPISDAVIELCEGADLLIHDAQYTPEELDTKHDWGHSTMTFAVKVALESRARHLVLFHHDPAHDDAALDSVLAEARARAGDRLMVSAAAEGSQLSI
jgi:ribonuclease BN (tRNA processing enzyme)